MSVYRADSVPQKTARVASRTVGGQSVVVVLDQRQVHRLDAVGSRIWELCDGRSVQEICTVVAEEFGVEPDVVLRDALPFLSDLQRVGALSPEASP